MKKLKEILEGEVIPFPSKKPAEKRILGNRYIL